MPHLPIKLLATAALVAAVASVPAASSLAAPAASTSVASAAAPMALPQLGGTSVSLGRTIGQPVTEAEIRAAMGGSSAATVTAYSGVLGMVNSVTGASGARSWNQTTAHGGGTMSLSFRVTEGGNDSALVVVTWR